MALAIVASLLALAYWVGTEQQHQHHKNSANNSNPQMESTDNNNMTVTMGGDDLQSEYLKQQEAEFLSNPVLQMHAENAIPGRYDNLPRLQSVYRDTSTELHPWQAPTFKYDRLQDRNSGSLLERQFKTLTDETPLDFGVLPQTSRGSGTMIRDPDTPDMLKPAKRENLDSDMFVAQGDPLKGRYVPVAGEQYRRAREQSKMHSASGALDNYQHVDVSVDQQDGHSFSKIGSTTGGPMRGFAGGEVMSYREGGFHPRERFFRVPETRRGRNQHNLRALNPTHATWNENSIYQTGTAPLGFLRENRNTDVREWHRPPERTGGIARQHVKAPFEFVDMPHQDRDPGIRKQLSAQRAMMGMGQQKDEKELCYNPDEFATAQGTQMCWTGPGGRDGIGQEGRRILDRYVRPKNLNTFQLEGWESAAHGSEVGHYAGADFSADLCDRMTHRTLDDDRTTRAPNPFNPRGNSAAYSVDGLGHGYDRPHFDKTTANRAHGPNRGEDMTADAFSANRFQEVCLRPTSKEEERFIRRDLVHAPVENRMLGVQYDPQPACPVTRRQQPTVVNDVDIGGTQAYRQNPYTQPLPMYN